MNRFYTIGKWEFDLSEIAGISDPRLSLKGRFNDFLDFDVLLNSDFPIDSSRVITCNLAIDSKKVCRSFEYDRKFYLLVPVNKGLYFRIGRVFDIPNKNHYKSVDIDSYKMQNLYYTALNNHVNSIDDYYLEFIKSYRKELDVYREYLLFKEHWMEYKSLNK